MNVLREIEDHLRDEDAAEVCELLGITSYDLVERFGERIEERITELESLICPFYEEELEDDD